MKTTLPSRRGIWVPLIVLAWMVILPHTSYSAASPGITTQPQSTTNGPGVDVRFTVVASGQATLVYQWSANGTNLANSAHIGGATTATLTISNLAFPDAGIYRVVVSNTHGSVTSSNAVLGVQRVVAWGNNSGGQCDVPIATSNAVAIAAGPGSVTLRPDGTVFAWGSATYSPTNVPATLSNVVSITAFGAQDATLAVKADGTVATWGSTVQPPPGLSNVLAAAGAILNGTYASIGLNNDGTVAEWNGSGFIINDVAAGLSNIVSIAAGVFHFLAIKSDGTVVAWGGNTYGETNVPAGLNQVVQVAGGYGMSLALKSNGDLVGWGTDYYGILATAPLVHNVAQIACNPNTALALLSNGTMSTWGNNIWGALTVPAGLNSVVAIAADYQHDLAIIGGRKAPQLYQQPVGLTGIANQSVLFTASAVGNIPLQYQWRFNGTNIAGAKAATLLLTGVQPAQAGLYSVVITNTFGSVQSSDAALAIRPAMFISDPQDQTAVQGTAATFNVTAKSFPPLSYQWQFNGTNLAGQTNSGLTLNNVQPNDAGNYRAVAGNSYGSITGAVASLTVLTPPLILSQSTNLAVVQGGTASLFVTATGTDPLSYQWYAKGSPFPGATTASWYLGVQSASDAGDYFAVVSNAYGAVTSTVVTLTVLLPPSVTIQPANPFGVVGGSVTLNATGTGTAPLSYQWMKNGTNLTDGGNISGALTAGLTMTSLQLSDAGNYEVSVTNLYGNTASAADLFVFGTNCVTPPTGLVGWWKGDGSAADIVATNNGTLANVTFANGVVGQAFAFDPQIYGSYTGVKIADQPAYALTSSLTIEGWVRPRGDGYIIFFRGDHRPGQDPYFLSMQANNKVDFYITDANGNSASVEATLAYFAWTHLAATLDGGTGALRIYTNGVLAVQTFTSVRPFGPLQSDQSPGIGIGNLNDGGNNFPFLGDIDEIALYNRALSTTEIQGIYYAGGAGKCLPPVPPFISAQPASQAVMTNLNAAFIVAAGGTQPLNAQWYYNGTALADNGHVTGSTTTNLVLLGAQPADAGNYFVVITNFVGSVTSSVASLLVASNPPVIVQQPQSQTVAVGTSALFTATATGDEPLNLRWYFNGAALADGAHIAGSATGSLVISNVQSGDAGNYSFAATNVLGAATSSVVALTVLIPPNITTQPKGRSVPLGLATTFSAAASGSALTYQWQLNGTNIPGATGTSYAIAAVGTNDVGVYQFIASNAVSVAVSSNALLTLGPVAAWGNNNSGQALPPPGLSNVVALAGGSAFSLALKGDGTLVAWGSGVGTNVPAGLSNVVAIAAGFSHGLATRADGTVVSWGSGTGTNVPVTVANVVSVAGSSSHSLALRREGTVYEWGTTRNIPAPPVGMSKVTTASDGNGFSLAARSDGTVMLWGGFAGTVKLPSEFSVVPGLSNVIAVAAGYSWSLALKADGRIFAWGSGTLQTNVPASLTNAIAIATSGVEQSAAHCLGLRSNGLVVAWGSSSSGQATVPAALSNVVAIAAGSTHSLALVSDGGPVFIREPVGGTAFSSNQFTLSATVSGQTPMAFAWSFNGVNLTNATNASFTIANAQPAAAGLYRLTASNALGVATSLAVPVTVADSAPFLLSFPGTTNRAYVGSQFTLTAVVNGSGPLNLQWLFNGQALADETNADLFFKRLRPAHSGQYSFIASNALGAVTSSVTTLLPVTIAAWGSSIYGTTNIPVSLTNAIAVALNSENAVALRADGTIATWGQMGTVVPAAISNVVQVAPSSTFCLTLRTDGTVRSWNISSALSNSLASLSNIVAIEADSFAGTFLRPDGTVIRILGSGATNLFPQLTNIVALSKFYDGFAALRADGTVFTSGSGTAPPVSVTSNVLDIALERTYGAVLKRDGSLQSWGAFSGPTNVPNMIAVCANAGVRAGGTVVPWVWTPNGPALANVPAGMANVDAVDASSTAVLALLVARDFPLLRLPDALNTTALVVSSRGSPQWFGETNLAHDGLDAAQSAQIGNNTASSMRMWIAGPVTVSFWWKVSSETNHDLLSFSADGIVLTNISGETGWQQCTVTTPPGNQILQWTYAKDSSGSGGQDAAWVDQLVITPITPTILTQPVGTNVSGGANVTFTVSATGTPPLSYNWQKDGNPIATTTAAAFALVNVARSNSGIYSVVVTNIAGNATSSNAVLSVHVPQLLGTPILQPDGSLLLSSTDVGGGLPSLTDLANFQVQVSTNLTDWITFPGALTETNGMLQLHDPAATGSDMRFYRIIENW